MTNTSPCKDWMDEWSTLHVGDQIRTKYGVGVITWKAGSTLTYKLIAQRWDI